MVGWTYEQDRDKIKSAEKELDDFYRQDEIDDLNNAKDAELEVLTERIENWEDYKTALQQQYDAYEQQKNDLLLMEMLGVESQEELYELLLTDMKNFTVQYEAQHFQLGSDIKDFFGDYSSVFDTFLDKYREVLAELEELNGKMADSISTELEAQYKALDLTSQIAAGNYPGTESQTQTTDTTESTPTKDTTPVYKEVEVTNPDKVAAKASLTSAQKDYNNAVSNLQYMTNLSGSDLITAAQSMGYLDGIATKEQFNNEDYLKDSYNSYQDYLEECANYGYEAVKAEVAAASEALQEAQKTYDSTAATILQKVLDTSAATSGGSSGSSSGGSTTYEYEGDYGAIASEVLDAGTYSEDTIAAANAAIEAAQAAWWAAYEAQDQEAMDAAHEAAENARETLGYHGGTDGSDYITSYSTGIVNGPVTYTGLAMLHGSAASPEYVLNSDQAYNLLRYMSTTQPQFESTMNTDTGDTWTLNGDIVLENCNDPAQFWDEVTSAMSRRFNVTKNRK